MGNESLMQTLKRKNTYRLLHEVFITCEVLILFSRLEKGNKNKKYLTKRLKELKKLIIRREEIMKVNVLAGINC